MPGVDSDPFDAAYARGITRAPRQPKPAPTDHRIPSRAAPTQPVALGGTVLTPDQQRPKAWVVVDGGTIAAVTSKKPAGVRAITTNGVIVPGLVDLHGHPEYNVFAAWEPPRLYLNRQGWRDSHEYAAVVKTPWALLTDGGTSQSVKSTMTRYAEVRALIGGVTAIQGASEAYPKQSEALVRNVDLWIFGQHLARSTVDFGRLTSDDISRLRKHLVNGDVKAHYVHLAEGKPGNTAAIHEFEAFARSGLMGPATVAIHGTALSRGHFADLRDAGGKLVWSPQSNLRLYGQTTDIASALDTGLRIALGADWLPSGSRSLLDEMRVAQRVSAEQGRPLSARDLVIMVTRTAAEIAALEDHLGRLEAGRPADLVVLQRRDADGYESVLASDPSAVDLVMIGGDAVYGRSDLLTGIIDPADYEPLVAWGRPMLIDTRYQSPEDPEAPGRPARRLTEMRRRLIARYPNVGPILA